MSVKSATALLLVLCCAPAFAQDDPSKKPPPPTPAPAEEPKAPAKSDAPPAAKKERKVDPAAQKALDRHASLVHYPATSGYKNLTAKGDLPGPDATIGVDPKWSSDKGFDFDVKLPEKIVSAAVERGATEEQATESIKHQLAPLVNYAGVNAVFELPGKNWVHYDIVVKQEGDSQVVELTPFDDKADAERRRYVFGKDGLLKSTSMTPKIDPASPQAQMMAGMTFSVDWTYEKRGERNPTDGRVTELWETECEKGPRGEG